MSIAGVICTWWQDSWGDHSERCLGVEITPDTPTGWARRPCFKTPFVDPLPFAAGDRVEVPVHHADGHVIVAGERLRMLGGLYDRDQPLR